MAFLAEPFISSTIEFLLSKLDSLELLKLASRDHVYRELEKWRKILPKIHAAVNDAEQKQLSNQQVKIWLKELQDLAYDVEDILDEFTTAVSCKKQQACSSKVKHKISGFLAPLNPKDVMLKSKMLTRIKDITNRMQEIVTQKNYFDLKNEDSIGCISNSFKRLPSTCMLDEIEVYDRENEKEAIIELLLNNKGCDEAGVCVIPIVGMGGVGKTTLAQLIYNDERVTQSFDVKAWSCVSEDFDVVRVTKTILEAITSDTCDASDFGRLQVSLRDNLVGKKVLIVLDDVWNENYDGWTLLRTPIQLISQGCKIIVTTRNQRVAAIMGTVPSYLLKELTFEASLSLFARHALGRRNFDDHPNLKETGEQIVQRCKGLPLAVKAVGGLLRTKTNHNDWENVLQSKMWDSPEDSSGVLPALRVSYNHLPSHLKPLFAFCSIFPKGYEFYQEELVLFWMGEGFLPKPGGKHMEDLNFCFKELLSRSFFQQLISNKSLFMMHDLISDLAQSVAGEMCIHWNSNNKLEDDQCRPSVAKTRHLSFTRQKHEKSLRFKNISKFKHLRTLIALPLHASPRTAHCYLSSSILHEVLLQLRRLRVLSLNGYCLSEIPTSIGGLKHLRYLDLSRTTIKCLPESVCTLINLQTLILSGCKELVKLPQGIGNLINLCHLNIADTYLHEMPLQIGNLTSLQKLPKFILGKDNGFVLGELKELKNLQGELSILGLHNVADAQQAFDANIRSKQSLVKLELQWSKNFQDLRDPEYEMRVLNFLQPHTNLKELKVLFYAGLKFPYWMGDTSFANIVNLKLSSCRNCTSLPPLETLTSLRTLCIEGMDAVTDVFSFHGNSSSSVRYFPSLEMLEFKDMLRWKHWISHAGVEAAEDKFPCLRELTLENCPNLIGELPSRFPSLAKLTIINCPLLGGSRVSLPSLHELIIAQCNEVVLRSMVDVTSLTTLTIKKMSKLACLGDWLLLSSGALKTLVICECSNLTFLFAQSKLENFVGFERLSIEACPHFVSLVENRCVIDGSDMSPCVKLKQLTYRLQGPKHLKYLSIKSCPTLLSISDAGPPAAVRHLMLNSCQALESMPVMMMCSCHIINCCLEELEIEDCPSLKFLPKGKLPSTLKRFKIRNCRKLQALPEGIMHNDNSGIISQLEYLEIIDCPSLTSFPAGLLATVRHLVIKNCQALGSMPDVMMCYCHIINCCLEELEIEDCPSFLHKGKLPLTLKRLKIRNFTELQALPDGIMHNDNSSNNSQLKHLEIIDCPSLTSFPAGKFPIQLKTLKIWDCLKLEPVSEGMLHDDTSLEYIDIWNCGTLTGLPECHNSLKHLTELRISYCSGLRSFPEAGLSLPKLTILRIYYCDSLKSLPNQMRNLTSLQELIVCGCKELAASPKWDLPLNLTYLEIWGCGGLDGTLSDWNLQSLTSLRDFIVAGGFFSGMVFFPSMKFQLPTSLVSLSIEQLPKLEVLSSQIQNLTSLEELEIVNCPKLQSLPRKGLPPTLGKLTIRECPLLEQKCFEKKGKYSSLMTHIPFVETDYQRRLMK